MSDEFAKTLLQSFPQLIIAAVFLAGLYVVLKEYRRIQSETRSAITDQVASYVGKIIGDLAIKSTEAERILKDFTMKSKQLFVDHGKFEQSLAQFQGWLEEEKEKYERMAHGLEERVKALGIQVDMQEKVTRPASVLARLAKEAASFSDALQLLKEAQQDPDAGSKDLELVGNAFMKWEKWLLARDLHTKAVELDPSNLSAKMELLGLEAEKEPEKREQALDEARSIVLGTLSAPLCARAMNAYYELRRYKDVQTLCEEILTRDLLKDSDIAVQAHRDLAVAFLRQGDPAMAESHFAQAVHARPDDENVLMAYAAFLVGQQHYKKAHAVATKLLMLDPLDARYYNLLGRIHTHSGAHQEAASWFSKAQDIAPPNTERYLEAVAGEARALRRMNICLEENGQKIE
jgi:tetratricopeptide (TPR) repeat protein